MRRCESIVVIALAVSLMGNEVSWAFSLEALAHGSHHVAVRPDAGHFDVVLHHQTDAPLRARDRHLARHATPAELDDSHEHHRDHVVKLPGVDGMAASTKVSYLHREPAITVATVRGSECSGVRPSTFTFACSRVGPPTPPRSSILRI